MLVPILAIDLYTIGAAKVLDEPLAAHKVDARMISAHPIIVQHQVTLFRPAKDKLVFLGKVDLLPACTIFQTRHFSSNILC
jgi:hypothetical protein